MGKELLEKVVNQSVDGNLNSFFCDVSNSYVELGDDLLAYDDERFTDFRAIGEIVFNPNEKLVVVTVRVLGDLTERSGKKAQYEKAKKILKDFMKYDAGIFVFSDAAGSFRFSLVYGQAQGTKRVFSNFRRFTHFVSRDQTNKTFYDRIGRCDFSSLDVIKDAFSVEKVNKEFYQQIARYYYRLTGKNDYKKELVLPSVGEDDERKYEEFAVRLIGRIIFCWFLRHKKSSGGIPLIPREVLSLGAAENHRDYYHSILEPLFFEVMNRPVKERKPVAVPQAELIPFLNGGLFEPHRNDYYEKAPNYALKIPDGWFADFFSVLEQYNFTIDENSTVDADVSVDPEMLGRIFENLLAEVVPETGETARKATGSYYTPRAIVDYMVEQSLKQYLLTKTGLPEHKLDSLLSYEDSEIDLPDAERNAVVTALKEIKVIDPACGSGAFPMGILHRMLLVLEKVDPRLEIWKRLYLGSYHPVMRRIIEDKLRKGNEQYIRKLTIIQDSIYGVDIQPIAVEIAKLRCFLSLVVDEIVLDNEENRGIEPLPNLEFKFVAANTLIGLPKTASQSAFGVTETINRLKELRESYLRSFGAEKAQIEKEFRATQQKLFKENVQWAVADTLVKQLTEWDPFSYESCGWFDPGWMFGVGDGFDVAIGNPPYLESRSPKFSQQLKDAILAAVRRRWEGLSSHFTRGSDLLVYFIETSLHLIKPSGSVVLISQNAWLDTLYGKEVQQFLMKTTDVLLIADSDYKYFDSREGPNINTVISIFKGRSPHKDNVLTFARFHQSFDLLEPNANNYAELNKSGKVDFSQYKYSEPLLTDIKWGILATVEECTIEVLRLLRQYGQRLESVLGQKLSVGQGLNLSSDYIVDSSILEEYPFLQHATIPFMTSSDGARYVLSTTENFLVDEYLLNMQQRKALKAAKLRLFDRNSTTKKYPALIMPRGVSRHFCALNKARAYSSSFVDVYDDSVQRPEDSMPIMNLWLFFNSTIGWLLREISGRKNLGGGLLKAEAADINQFPVYIDFYDQAGIKSILKRVEDREVLDTIEELDTTEHIMIDDIVCNRLGITDQLRHRIVDALKRRVLMRSLKSIT